MTLIKSSIPLTVYRAESPLLANITGDQAIRLPFHRQRAGRKGMWICQL